MPQQQNDEFAQFARKPSAPSTDEFAQFARGAAKPAAPIVPPSPTDALSKATSIGPGPGTGGQIMQQIKGGLTAAQPGQGMKRQPTTIGNVAELAGFLGDTLATFGTAEGLSMASKAIPSANRAAQALNKVAQVANPVLVDTTDAMKIADRAMELGKRGHKVPQVITDFAAHTSTGKPVTFQEVRDFYSAATAMSSQEVQETKAIMKGQLGKFTNALHDSLTDAASKVNMGDTYEKAIKDYAKAKSMYRTAKRIAQVAIPAAIGGAAWKYGRAINP